mgnify:CR=1 FL=1
MYEGEGMGRLIVDLDALLGEAMGYKNHREDLAFPLGRALMTLYPERTNELLLRMNTMWRLANEDETPRDAQTN